MGTAWHELLLALMVEGGGTCPPLLVGLDEELAGRARERPCVDVERLPPAVEVKEQLQNRRLCSLL